MKIGIRKEDKNIWERRVPLAPHHVGALRAQGIEIKVEPSPNRTFADSDYKDAGAELSADLSDCQVVMAVKEIPTPLLRAGQTYVYFAHVIKGQPHNMPMLKRLLALGSTLIDYEKVVDEKGRRLIFFGRHAGLAGMVDTFWALGQRLGREGIETPFQAITLAHTYPDLSAIREAVSAVGRRIAQEGLPSALKPLVVGFAGYGNVSRGAQEIFDLLPHREIAPEELGQIGRSDSLVKVVFREEHMAVHRQGSQFDLQEYYKKPELYRGVFGRYVPHLTVLVNAIYWTRAYPRLVSRDLLWGLYGRGGRPRLRVIGDISCDIEGGVECTLEATDPADPVYVYLPAEDRIVPGVDGPGPVVLAVDNLPCELPREASNDFGDALLPFVAELARADLGRPFEELALSPPLRGAVIAHKGRLTPAYAYLEEHLAQSHEES